MSLCWPSQQVDLSHDNFFVQTRPAAHLLLHIQLPPIWNHCSRHHVHPNVARVLNLWLPETDASNVTARPLEDYQAKQDLLFHQRTHQHLTCPCGPYSGQVPPLDHARI